jgi:hypothetical protein
MSGSPRRAAPITGNVHQDDAEATREQSRIITPAEVIRWFGHGRKPRPCDAECGRIAGRLTKMRWPCDAARLPKQEIDTNIWWDFKGATDATNTLLASVPAMLKHWEGLRWAPKTRAGHEAIRALGDALSLALPYIEWPFEKYERQTGRKTPKDWHIPAVVIATIIVPALVQSGRVAPGLSHNSIVVRVVREALTRMGYPNMKTDTSRAIGAHLTRWDKKWGMATK